ncbi:hypothetical protein VTI28DRAFT_10597 [Corynascus sepedonium]
MWTENGEQVAVEEEVHAGKGEQHMGRKPCADAEIQNGRRYHRSPSFASSRKTRIMQPRIQEPVPSLYRRASQWAVHSGARAILRPAFVIHMLDEIRRLLRPVSRLSQCFLRLDPTSQQLKPTPLEVWKHSTLVSSFSLRAYQPHNTLFGISPPPSLSKYGVVRHCV